MKCNGSIARRKESCPDHRKDMSPFFYGLITFEREFRGTKNYVRNHMEGACGKARDLVEYLAVATLYGKQGVHNSIARGVLHPTLAESSVDLKTLLPEGVSNLTSRRNQKVKLVHQLVAKVVLQLTVGGVNPKDWKRLGLKDMAIDFVHDVARVVQSDSEIALELFRQIFVERTGVAVRD